MDNEKELNETLYSVAKMKAEFDLLKRVIIRNLELNYTKDGLMIGSDTLIIEVMKVLEPALLADIFEQEKIIDENKEAQKNG